MKLLMRWLIASLALVVAAWLVPGIHVSGNAWLGFAVLALLLGLVNALVRPLLRLLSCPLILLTLGFFLLVINAVCLLLAAWIARRVGLGVVIEGFWPAFWGALVVTVVTWLLSVSVKED